MHRKTTRITTLTGSTGSCWIRSREAGGDNENRTGGAGEDPPDALERRPPRRLGLPVARERRGNGRQNGAAVSVHGGAATDSSLQRRTHRGPEKTPAKASRVARI